MKTIYAILLGAFLFITLASTSDCATEPVSTSGVSKANTTVETALNGNTIEQNNIIDRLHEDNKPGSIKHLYIISAYSGEVLIYSTVKGKVTSSGKRLSPSTITGENTDQYPFAIDFNGNTKYTNEVLGDDGTYGNSVEYLYWWDSKGVYHQQYVTGGMILHISNQPIAVKSVTMNFESN
jgi:hypothetical protein